MMSERCLAEVNTTLRGLLSGSLATELIRCARQPSTMLTGKTNLIVTTSNVWEPTERSQPVS